MRFLGWLAPWTLLVAGCLEMPADEPTEDPDSDGGIPSDAFPRNGPVDRDGCSVHLACDSQENDTSGQVYMDVRGLRERYPENSTHVLWVNESRPSNESVNISVAFEIYVVNGLNETINLTWSDGQLFQIWIRDGEGNVVVEAPRGCAAFTHAMQRSTLAPGASKRLTYAPWAWDGRPYGPHTECGPLTDRVGGTMHLLVKMAGGYSVMGVPGLVEPWVGSTWMAFESSDVRWVAPCPGQDLPGCEVEEDDTIGIVHMSLRGLEDSYERGEFVRFQYHVVNGLAEPVELAWSGGTGFLVIIRGSDDESVRRADGCFFGHGDPAGTFLGPGSSRRVTNGNATWDQRTFGIEEPCKEGRLVPPGEYTIVVAFTGCFRTAGACNGVVGTDSHSFWVFA